MATALYHADLALARSPAERAAARRVYSADRPTGDSPLCAARLFDLYMSEADAADPWRPFASTPAGRLAAADRAADALREIRSLCCLSYLPRWDLDWEIVAADGFRVRAMLDMAGSSAEAVERAVAVLRAAEMRSQLLTERGLDNQVVVHQAAVRRLNAELAGCRSDAARAVVRAELRAEAEAGLRILAEVMTFVSGENWDCATRWPDTVADLARAEWVGGGPATRRLDWCRRAERAAAGWAPRDTPFSRDVWGRAELRRLAAERGD